jgi:sensor histidine kinase YesM
MEIINSENQIYLISNLFRIYVLFKFINVFLKRRDIDIKIEIFGYLVYFIINSILYLKFQSPIINLMNNIVLFFLLTYLYKGEIKVRLLVTGLNFAIGLGLEAGVYYIVSNMYFLQGEVLLLTNVISIVLFFIVTLVIEKKSKYKTGEVLENNYFYPLLLIPIGSIIIITTTFLSEIRISNTLMSLNTFVLLLINFLVFFLYDGILKSYRKEFENRVLIQQNKAYRNQFDIIKESQEKIKIMRHDLKNHISALTVLARDKNTNKMLNYLETIGDAIEVEKEYVKTGNRDIDSILNYKIREAKECNIEVITKIKIPKEFNTSSFDLNVILGNLIDNAIEALEKVDEKKLEIEMNFIKGVFYINISNIFNGKIIKENNKFKSIKRNDEFHGIGIESVKKIVDKYNGITEINYLKNKFIVEIMLFNKNNSK